MRWTLSEFLFEMEMDPRRKVLFVEGIRDHVFWSKTLSVPRGPDTVVYTIASLECEKGPGGERGRLMRCADSIQHHPLSHRILFFADADYDRILNVPLLANVALTDGRDLESYFFLARCLDHLCETLLPEKGGTAESFLNLIDTIARPIGILRISCQRAKMELPFMRTLQNGLSRYVVENDAGIHVLNVSKLMEVLLQNYGGSRSDAEAISANFIAEVATQRNTSNFQIVHGKDMARLISWKFGIAESFAGQLLILALASGLPAIRASANIDHVSQWLI